MIDWLIKILSVSIIKSKSNLNKNPIFCYKWLI